MKKINGGKINRTPESIDLAKFAQRTAYYEKVLRLAEQIKALGGILSSLAYYEGEGTRCSVALEEYGQDYSQAVVSLAGLIEKNINDVYHL